MEYIIAFCWGWFVSFAGQLPLGTMSITSAQIAVEENFRNAWKYSLGVALIEIIYLRFTLSGVDWIIQHKLIFEILGWLTVAVFLVLGILTFRAALKQTEEKKAYLLNNNLNRYILGITMSALNPAQIPFWFIWSSALIDSKALHSTTTDFNLFTAGAGLGTISGLALYMYGGNWIITKMKAGTKIINIIMGVIFIIAALAQLYRMLFGEFIEK